MWTTRLLILGLVRWLQPVHGYEVQRELMSWGVQDWARVKRGSIYHALKTLAADGCLEVVATESVANRPARTSYRITQAGEEEFQSQLRESLWDSTGDYGGFWVAWSFVPVLSRRETAAMLRNRARLLREPLDSLDSALANRDDDPSTSNFLPFHIVVSLRLKRDYLISEISWCEETAVLAETGQLYVEHSHDMSAETAAHWKKHINTLDGDGSPSLDPVAPRNTGDN